MRGLGLCLLAVATRTASCQAANVAESYLLAAANQDRLLQHLPALRRDDHLALAARQHAYEMAKRQTISHQFSNEANLASRAQSSGANFSTITENVAEAPNPAEIHELWMRSPGHRANLLDGAVDAVGIAVVRSRGQFFAVEDFAHTIEQLTLMQQESEVAELIASKGLVLDQQVEDARRTCQLSSGYAGVRRPWFVMRYTTTDLHRLPKQLSTRLASGRYRGAAVGACPLPQQSAFTSYSLAVMLFP